MKSLAEQIAQLPEKERDSVMAGLDPESLLWDASFWLRPEQQVPSDDSWRVTLALAGRGWGKTRMATEWIREKARTGGADGAEIRLLLVARTAADVRDVIIEGESGIMAISPPSERPEYYPSRRKLVWPNGNSALAFSSDEPDQLRGPQGHYGYADELAAYRQMPDSMGLTAWDQLNIAIRLGRNPQIMATTTPKKVKVIRDLIAESRRPDSRIIVRHGSTSDNAGNLSESYLEAIYAIYGGTRLAQQELNGELLDDIEGALWTESMLEEGRTSDAPLGLPLRVVGVDPTVAERPGDECGIVVVLGTAERETYKRECWVVDDLSIQGSPETWAARAVMAARKWGAPIIAETNQGGALVRAAINSIDPGVPVLEVHSRVGKQLRAEPVALAYEQGRVHHLGVLADLESQMLSWEPGVGKSPDRIDALVHAVTALMVSPPAGMVGGRITATSVSRRSLPGMGGGTPFGVGVGAAGRLPVTGTRGRRGGRVIDLGKYSR